MTLQALDYLNAIRYILKLRAGEGHIDDIDHLGNRRVRTIDELAADELRKGFLKLRRTVQERMSIRDQQDMTPRTLINPKSISRGHRVLLRPRRAEPGGGPDQPAVAVDARAPAVGPRAGRPEPQACRLRRARRAHLALRPHLPDRDARRHEHRPDLAPVDLRRRWTTTASSSRRTARSRSKKLSGDAKRLRADEESQLYLAPADTPIDGDKIASDRVIARFGGDFELVPSDQVQYIDISPKQMVGVSAGLIPFLEHDDANRALMGSNMQRQAVPLLVTEPPIVATGLEKDVATNSGMVVRAETATAPSPTSMRMRIRVDEQEYVLRKFAGLNEHTCLNQKPIVKVGQKVKKGQVLADGAATRQRRAGAGPQRAGRVHVVGRLQLRGRDHHQRDGWWRTTPTPRSTSRSSRSRSARRSWARRSSPATSRTSRPRRWRNLDDYGIVRIGTFVQPGDILVGKVSPKSKSELTPEEKLLHAIFGRAGEDVKNDSLEVPSGVEGIVIDTQRFSRRAGMTEEEKKAFDKEHEGDWRPRLNKPIADQFRSMMNELAGVLDVKARQGHACRNKTLGQDKDDKVVVEQVETFRLDHLDVRVAGEAQEGQGGLRPALGPASTS